MTTLFLLLLAASLSPSSASTLAVAAGSTACAVVSENSTVFCSGAGGANSSLSVPSGVAQFVRFTQVASGGGAVVCGIQLGGRALFCWPAAAPEQLRRVYNGPNPLSDLAVGGGGGHVAAYDPVARVIRWWRGVGRFPDQVAGGFGSLVSGDEFTCAVETNTSSVRCWGPRGGAVEADFVNASVSSLSAGGSRACAVKTNGAGVICSGSGEGAVVPRDIYVDGLAVGESHACGLRRPNRTAVCWTLGGPTTTIYWPAVGTAFEFLVAGGNLTCGLVSSNFSLMCWSTDGSVAAEVNLPPILPGVCVAAAGNNSSCKCGVFPDSGRFCRVSGEVICNRFCDTPSPSPPPPPSSSPPPATPTSKRGVSKWWIAFAVVGAVGCFAGICSIIYCLLFGFCSHKKIHNSVQPNLTAGNNTTAAAVAGIGSGGPSPYGSPNGSLGRLRRQLSRVMTRQRSGPSSFKDPAEEFPFSQLAAATRDFSPEFKIGEGSFGTVYRGKLADGREVAIKRGGGRKFQEKETAFRSELAFLSRLHHKHLVGFVGYCEENDERLLVYEFMKNGALYDHLHPKPSSSPATAPPLSPVATSWKLRIKILLDASRGIDYLHSYAVPPIIHRDIKSSNILIDSSWTARVSDFGLSLMGTAAPAPEAMKAAGTVGYMDPEYYGLHHLTVKSDVYGFGVVMLEVLTGKRAIFKEAEGGSPVSVVDYAVPSIVAGELAKVLDGRAPEPAPHEAEAVELVAYTAVHCVRLEGKDRPAMADIVANLETAVALCDAGAGAGGVYGNSSSSASLSITSMELSRLD